MKIIDSTTILLLSVLAARASSQLVYSAPVQVPEDLDIGLPSQAGDDQAVIGVPGIAMPPSNDDDNAGGSDDPVIISDVIGKERSINIFAGFTRDIESISKRLDDGSKNTTVLVPLNSALMDLPRKPWEDPEEYNALGESAYEGSSGVDRAHRNLQRFVEAHVVPTSPWKEDEKVESLQGDTLWYEIRDGKKMIQPGDVEVSSVASKVANGEVWILKNVINYARSST